LSVNSLSFTGILPSRKNFKINSIGTFAFASIPQTHRSAKAKEPIRLSTLIMSLMQSVNGEI